MVSVEVCQKPSLILGEFFSGNDPKGRYGWESLGRLSLGATKSVCDDQLL